MCLAGTVRRITPSLPGLLCGMSQDLALSSNRIRTPPFHGENTGSTPVGATNLLVESKIVETMNKNKESLGSRLKKAATQEELSALVGEGAGYQFASPATRRKWERVITAKKIAFESAAATKKDQPPPPPVAPQPPRRKRNKVNKAKKGAA